MSTDDAAIGFDSPAPRCWIPYSVSSPNTLRSATKPTLPLVPGDGAPLRDVDVVARPARQQLWYDPTLTSFIDGRRGDESPDGPTIVGSGAVSSGTDTVTRSPGRMKPR